MKDQSISANEAEKVIVDLAPVILEDVDRVLGDPINHSDEAIRVALFLNAVLCIDNELDVGDENPDDEWHRIVDEEWGES